MIEISDINKRFEGDARQTLTAVSAQFSEGATNLIIGRSGSGKTVLMKCIIGLLVPDSGTIRYDGRDFLSMGKQEMRALRQEMGVLFQGSALFDSMSVLENVRFPLEMFSAMSPIAQRERAMECLERVGMAEAADKMPSEISGGMQKRAAIARAIVLKPRYLFCDEPNSGLDPVSSMMIDELIYSITKESGMTTIVNTHDMNSVLGIGENILFIHEGCAAWKGSKDDVLQSDNALLRDFLSPALRLMQK